MKPSKVKMITTLKECKIEVWNRWRRATHFSPIDLTHADLTWAGLTRANLDYSSWPLWCGSLMAKTDYKLQCQLMTHTISTIWVSDEKLAKALLRSKKIAEMVGTFHRYNYLSEDLKAYLERGK